MVQKVEIDIPGIGKIEAKNAASEKTLQDILRALQGRAANANGGAQPGSGGGAAAAARGGAAGAAGAGAAGGALGGVSKAATRVIGGLGKMAGGLAKVAGGAGAAVGAFASLATGLSNTLAGVANMGDSLESAARIIPVFGGFFAPIMAAMEKSTNAFFTVAESGATFGNSVNGLAAAASGAGMTMEKYAALIAKNSESMALLGGNTEDGAQRFAQLGKQMRNSGFMGSLNNMGFTTEQVNQGMAGYIKNLGMQNKLSGKSNADLVAGTKAYLTELDLTAKVTGQTRKDAEEARNKLLNDAQFQAKVSNMSEKAGAAFMNTVERLPKPLQDIAKDIMVTGTATTEESQKFSATMPKSAELMRKFAEITNKGGTISADMQNQLRETMRVEGETAKIQYADQGKYNKEMGSTYMTYVAAANMQKDAIKSATEAQAKAAKSTDALAAATEANKRRIAEVSNAFTMFLANSGMMEVMMRAFELTIGFLTKYVIPAFKLAGDIISWIVKALESPIGQVVIGLGAIAFAIAKVWPIISALGSALAGVGSILMGAVSTLWGVLSTVGALLSGAVTGLMTALGALFWPVTAVVAVLIGLYAAMKYFNLDFQYVGEWIKDKFLRGFYIVSDYLKDKFAAPFYAVSDYIQDTFRPTFEFLGRMFDDAGTYVQALTDKIVELKDFMVSKFLQTFQDIRDWFAGGYLQTFKDIKNWFATKFIEPFEAFGNWIQTTFMEAFKKVSDWFGTYFIEPFKVASDWFKTTFKPILDWLGTKFTALSTFIDQSATAVANLFRGFNKLSEVGEFLAIKFKDIVLALKTYELMLEEKITFSDAGKAELAKKQAALLEEQTQQTARKAALEKQMEDNRKANLVQEQKNIEKDAKDRGNRGAVEAAEREKRDKELDAKKNLSEAELKKRQAERDKAAKEGGKKTVEATTGAAATAGSEAASKAVECAGIDYSSPEAMFKSFQESLGGSGAKDAKKKDLADAQVEAEKKLKAAKTPEEKKAAEDVLAKIKTDQERVSKVSPGYAETKTSAKSNTSAPAEPKTVAAKDNEAAKKEIEAKAEKEKTDKAAAEKAAAEKAAAEKNKTGNGQPQPGQQQPAQESSEVLLARLNTSVTELVRINKQAVDVHEQQLRVQKSLSGDVYTSPVAYT
jgi:hypothetical protein